MSHFVPSIEFDFQKPVKGLSLLAQEFSHCLSIFYQAHLAPLNISILWMSSASVTNQTPTFERLDWITNKT